MQLPHKLSSKDEGVLQELLEISHLDSVKLSSDNVTKVKGLPKVNSPWTVIVDTDDIGCACSSTVYLVAQEILAIEALENDQDFGTAIDLLHDIIGQHPGYASAYNNLSQVYRVMIQQDLIPETHLDQIYEVIIDSLETCLSLSQPIGINYPNRVIFVTNEQKTLLRSSHTQLALVFMELASRLKVKDQDTLLAEKYNKSCADEELLPQDERWNFEMAAHQHFVKAGLYGNKWAEDLAVFYNPYAKLCGNMVRKAFVAEYSCNTE